MSTNMSNDLYATLGERADRAAWDPDLDGFLRDVHERVERGQRRRRNLIAAGSGVVAVAAVVVAVVAATIVTVPDHSDHHIAPAGARPSVSAATGSSALAASESADAAKVLKAVAARARAALQARVARQPPAAADLRPHGHLVVVDPAPESAPLSIGLSAKGWTYLASVSDATTYGTSTSPSPHDASVFEGKISLVVGDNLTDPGPFPLTVGRFEGSLRKSDGVQILDLSVRSDRIVTIQVPAATHLTSHDVIDLGKTLSVRDLSHAAGG